MNSNTVSTRRRFLCGAGAALSAPLTAAAINISPANGGSPPSAEPRPGNLEEVNAIRKLQQDFARLVNRRAHKAVAGLFAVPSKAGVDAAITGLSADPVGEDDVIELAPDRQSATGLFHCTVQTETAIGPACTLVDMARAQGDGFVERSQPCVFEVAYVKQAGAWKILRAAHTPTA
jgi:hypothetical protein